ncbi:hypothetical protein Tco_1352924 [Tanacetum coccineum]
MWGRGLGSGGVGGGLVGGVVDRDRAREGMGLVGGGGGGRQSLVERGARGRRASGLRLDDEDLMYVKGFTGLYPYGNFVCDGGMGRWEDVLCVLDVFARLFMFLAELIVDIEYCDGNITSLSSLHAPCGMCEGRTKPIYASHTKSG